MGELLNNLCYARTFGVQWNVHLLVPELLLKPFTAHDSIDNQVKAPLLIIDQCFFLFTAGWLLQSMLYQAKPFYEGPGMIYCVTTSCCYKWEGRLLIITFLLSYITVFCPPLGKTHRNLQDLSHRIIVVNMRNRPYSHQVSVDHQATRLRDDQTTLIPFYSQLNYSNPILFSLHSSQLSSDSNTYTPEAVYSNQLTWGHKEKVQTSRRQHERSGQIWVHRKCETAALQSDPPCWVLAINLVSPGVALDGVWIHGKQLPLSWELILHLNLNDRAPKFISLPAVFFPQQVCRIPYKGSKIKYRASSGDSKCRS